MARLLKPDGLTGTGFTALTCEQMLRLGRAAAQALRRTCSHPPVFYISRDTRRCADALEAALCAGLCTGGGMVHCLGVLPSSAMALLLSEEAAEAGISLAGDSLPYSQITVQFYAKSGLPMSAEQLDKISALLPDDAVQPLKSDKQYGCIVQRHDAVKHYLEQLAHRLNANTPLLQAVQKPLLRIAVDCANGAVSTIVPYLLQMLGAEGVLLNDHPNGTNVCAECGVCEMDALIETVKANHCSAGFAFNGDGTRCLAVDAAGEMLCGDRMLALLCQDRLDRQASGGTMPMDATLRCGVAVTEETNLGFLRYAKKNGIPVYTVQAAPWIMTEQMQGLQLGLGSDGKGCIYFCDMPAADGLMTMARVIRAMQRKGRSLGKLAAVMEHDPQASVSVRIPLRWREIWKNDPEIAAYLAKCEEELGMDGRLVVRERGRDGVIRVMLEGRDFRRINTYLLAVAEMIQLRTAE